MGILDRVISLANTVGEGDTFSKLAGYILSNVALIRDIGAEDMARRCYVSQSTLNRFCKYVGCNSYSDFRRGALEDFADYEYRTVYVPRTAVGGSPEPEAFLNVLIEYMTTIRDNLDMEHIRGICRDMHEAGRVVHISGAFSYIELIFQKGLVLTGKQTVVLDPNMLPDNYTELFDGDTFVVAQKAESPGSRLIDRLLLEARERGARVLVISNASDFTMKQNANHSLTFNGKLAYADGFGLYAFLAIVSMTYRQMYLDEVRRLGSK